MNAANTNGYHEPRRKQSQGYAHYVRVLIGIDLRQRKSQHEVLGKVIKMGLRLDEIKKGSKNPTEMTFASVRLPKKTYDYIKANNISLRKLIMAAIEELKKRTE